MDFAVAAAGARTAERLRRRWILPSPLLEPEQPNACGNGGFCRRRWDGFQPLPPTGDSRKKKKGGGEICACFRTPIPLLAVGLPHLWYFDLLTVISLSPRKSPGEAGALSLTPDGVSDPAAASGPRPSEAIPPVAKQGGDAKQGEGEARKAGERAVTTL